MHASPAASMLSPENPLTSLHFGAASPREFAGEPLKKWILFCAHYQSLTKSYYQSLSVFITLYQYPGLRNSDFVTLHSQLTTEHTEHTDWTDFYLCAVKKRAITGWHSKLTTSLTSSNLGCARWAISKQALDSFGELKFSSSQPTLSYRVGTGTNLRV